MLSSLFESSTIPALEQVVRFTEARHGVLAGNIANLDTPDYRTRDLSPAIFQKNLREAIESRRGSRPASYPSYVGTASHPSSRPAGSGLEAFRKVEDSMKSVLYHDGSDISLEQQVNEMIKNQQQHNLAISIMTAQFRLLRAAITERTV